MTEKNKTYFLSDLHLKLDNKKETSELKDKLFRFLDKAGKDAEEIIFAGDLLDFWYEWYYVMPSFHFDLFCRLRSMADSGIKITYTAGNHDFMPGKFLSSSVGINCVKDEYVFERNGKRFFVSHGDGLAESDGGYRVLKAVLRSKISNFIFRTFIPPDLGVLLAKLTSKSSRKYKKVDRSKWKEEYFRFAEKKFNEGFDYVILGHLHLPEIRSDQKGVYLNTGDWISYYTYGVYSNGNLTLEKFDEQEKEQRII